MRRLVLILFVAVATSIHPGARADDEAAPVPDDSWTTIFDGRSLSGWEVPYPGEWEVRDGAIHGVVPEQVTWAPANLAGAYQGMNYIRTSRNVPSHHLALEVKGLKGRLGIGHWGTMKKTFTDSFFYGHDDWVEMIMTWQGGTVLLYMGGDRWDYSAEAREGENNGRIVLFLMPGSEVWLRNIRMKALPPAASGGRKKDPGGNAGNGGDAGGLLAGGISSWPCEGDWSLEGGSLIGRAPDRSIWLRNDETRGDGVLSFEYRAEGKGPVLTVLVDVADQGRRSVSIPLPAPGRGWRRVEVELSGERAVLRVDGAVLDTGRRSRPGGGMGFVVARGAAVEIRALRFE